MTVTPNAPTPPALTGLAARLAWFWRGRSRWLLGGALVVMFALAVIKLQDEIPRLMWGSGEGAATDIRKFHRLTYRWFEGDAIYKTMKVAVYPPATYALMWPLVGWLNLQGARLVWFVSTVFVGIALARLFLSECRPRSPPHKLFVVLMLVSLNATGVTIGIGQLGLHLMLAMVGGLLLVTRGSPSLPRDLAGAALVLWSLVKPPVTAPLFWLVVFVPGRLRPAILVVAGYAAVTLGALTPQLLPSPEPVGAARLEPITADQPDPTTDPGPAEEDQADESAGPLIEEPSAVGGTDILADSLGMGMKGAQIGSVLGGYGNVHSWLGRLGLGALNLVASVLIVGALGFWVWRHRRVDLWILLGVAALVARMWMYHRVYDDVLVLLPMVALYRLATTAWQRNGGWWAGGLLTATVLVMLIPARFRQTGRVLPVLFELSHVLMWLAILAFLMVEARRERRLEGSAQPG